MKKRWRWVLVIISLMVAAPLLILLLIHFTPEPPVTAMERARKAISRAEYAHARVYARKLYDEAQSLYDSGVINWQRQNRRFIYFRHYDAVADYARKSEAKAVEATENSSSTSAGMKTRIREKISKLNKLSAEIDTLFTTYPLDAEIRNRISKGKFMLKESEVLFESGDYYRAYRELTDSEYLLSASYDHASADLKNYFKAYSTWKMWIDKTLSDSKRSHDYSIIIDKFSRKCFVYLAGKKKYEFNAELGTNWAGNKRLKGDKATPEGMYRITGKFDRGRTKYYKALLLNYPNDEDRKRFLSEIENGTLPSTASIGGLIEIHGEGGKGVDWTEGCIALKDSHMDVLYKLARKGTPVTIVGSMTDLQSIMNR
ncbi:MAG TPA: L,D-transpeptidase [Bacteroidales bacterium]|nr:L,D-transpeptidase [Bacteroidales bacterium]